ncbi:MAG: AraC family transcriptional regulator [Spirochaetales bacterium]
MTILDVVFLYQLKEDQMVRWHSRRHAHPAGQYEFHYFVGGKGSFQQGGFSHPLQGGQLFLSCPGEFHEIRVTDLAHPISYYALLFQVSPDDELAPVLAEPAFRASFPVKIGTNQRLFFEDAKAKFALHDNPSRGRAASLRLEAFVHDLRADMAAPAELVPSGPFNLHVEQALGLLQAGVFQNLSLADICGPLQLTEEHLIRLFRKHLNLTPMKYLQVLKLETSMSLLLNTSLSVKEIAYKLGYPNQFLFSRNFRAHTGVPPTEYKRLYFAGNTDKYHLKILDTSEPRSISDISGQTRA